MPKFLAIYRQNGGCDYTIGCGLKVDVFQATSMDAAIASVTEGLIKTGDDAEFGDEEVKSLRKVDVYEIAVCEKPHAVLEPLAWMPARQAAHEKAARESAEAKERAELERLKRKYEK